MKVRSKRFKTLPLPESGKYFNTKTLPLARSGKFLILELFIER
jgi:hypothetical protein